MKRIFFLIAIMIASIGPASVSAQEWPTRPIRYIQPFQGLPDTLARSYNDKVAAILKQPLVPDYKLGVAGRIALGEIAKAEPSGYFIGMATSGPLVLAPVLYPSLPYDADKSFTVIKVLGQSPLALAVSATSKINSLQDLIALSKTRELNIATVGVGGPHHMAGVLLKKAGVKSIFVPFKSSAEIMPAMVNGDIDAYFDTVYQHDVFVKQGRYRAIAVTSARRMPQFPDVLTFAEIGHPEIDIHTFYATVAPAATPAPILAKLVAAYNAAGETAEVKAQLQSMALLPVDLPHEKLDQMMRDSRSGYKKIVVEHKITVSE